MPRPDHDKMMTLIRLHFNDEGRDFLTHTRWKDGIDVQYPTYAIEAFAVGAYAAIPQPAKTVDEWHEDIGTVMWWRFPICEAPYVGSPLDTDWPGDHTHWTHLPAAPVQPAT